jgi:hypothetical protein
MVWSSFRRPLQLQFIIEIISGVRRDDNDCASRAMPLAPARVDGLRTCAFGVVFLENMQAIDAGHDREIGNAAGSHGGPNRAQPHLTAGKARFDAFADAKALRNVFIRVDLDGAVRRRAEGQPVGFLLRLIAAPSRESAVR